MNNNTELQTAVTELFERLISGIDTGAAFLEAELPDYIMQLMFWHMASSAVWGAVQLIMTGAVVMIVVHVVRNASRYDADDPWFPIFMASLPSLIAGIIFLSLGLDNIETALQIWLAPKVWLVEYAAGLVK